MHRFMIFKKLPKGKSTLSDGLSEIHYGRTCSLCNRVNITPSADVSRVHSTWAHPEEINVITKKKKSRASKNTTSPAVSYCKSRKKMKIAVINAIETDALFPDSFTISSPSSPAFGGLKVSGVTIMLPPKPSRKWQDLRPRFRSVEMPRKLDSWEIDSVDISTLSKLLLVAFSRNRYLVQDNLPIRKPSLKETSLPQSSDVLPVIAPDQRSKLQFQGVQSSKELNLNHELKNVGDIVDMNYDFADANADTDLNFKPSKVDSRSLKEKISTLSRLKNKTCFIDICLKEGRHSDAINFAKQGLDFSILSKQCRSSVLDPLIFHSSNDGNISSLIQLRSLAKKYNATFSVQAYVSVFELLGRLPETSSNVDLIRIFLNDLEAEDIEIPDLLKGAKNRPVLLKKVLEAIRRVDPDTAALYSVVPKPYENDMLLPLNDTAKRKATRFYSPSSGLRIGARAEELVDEQIMLHRSQSFRLRNIVCDLADPEVAEIVKKQQKIEEEWKLAIAAGIEKGIKIINEGKRLQDHLTVYLKCLPLELSVNAIIQEFYSRLDDSDKQSIGFVTAQRALGKRVKDSYDILLLEKHGIYDSARSAHVEYCRRYANPELYPEGPSNPREIWESVVNDLDYDDSQASRLLKDWSLDIYGRIGKFLYEILLKDLTINENMGTNEEPRMVPALYVIYRKTTKGYQRQLKMHPAVHNIFPIKLQPYITMNPFDLPMVCPPRPWVSSSEGVYPLSTPSLQRCAEGAHGDQVLKDNIERVSTRQLYPSLDSLNQLSAVPWKINNPVLDVILEVFRAGGSKELDIPFPPGAAKPEPEIPQGATIAQREAVSKERARVRQENAAEFSLWCDTLYKLCIANEFRDRVFWLPHNMDFRGRVYPICPHLQHMSNDMARSMLIFAKGEKLGPDGLDWLKLHTINLVGKMNKMSLAARAAYANEALPKILASAENPLNGEKWWMDSEYPWQTLAACKEIANAISSGDPENFISHFPVHQDGSCNGLQHYAALGRDTLGAQSVNLVDTVEPSDVYSCVASSVEQQRAKDAAEGHKLAQSLEGFIVRKVVKQTVMTTVYGVTQFGAEKQIEGQLKDMAFPHDEVRPAAFYLTKLVFQSLGEMFTSSRNIQDWLSKCAITIVKSKGLPVQWQTPLGLPVVQPYFKKVSKEDNSNSHQNEPPHHRGVINLKQRNAFSPNFIHSLDSCHMALTGLYCEQANITFVSVHDCFWVHPRNTAAMNKICREQFVNLHSKPILQDLSKFLLKTYVNTQDRDHAGKCNVADVERRYLTRLFSAVPPQGSFDLNEVLKAKYFFS